MCCLIMKRMTLQVVIMAILAVLVILIVRFAIAKRRGALLSLSLHAKAKILLSFYQVISSLETVYGARLDEKLRAFFNIFNYLSLDIFGFISIPKSCIGSMQLQIIVHMLWPYAVLLMIASCLFLVRYLALHEHGSF